MKRPHLERLLSVLIVDRDGATPALLAAIREADRGSSWTFGD
jgi:hypothetical protein